MENSNTKYFDSHRPTRERNEKRRQSRSKQAVLRFTALLT